MTALQTQAYQIITQLPEKQLQTAVALLKQLECSTLAETGERSAAELKQRRKAYDNLEKVRREIAGLHIDFKDFDAELAEALAEKFASN